MLHGLPVNNRGPNLIQNAGKLADQLIAFAFGI